MFWIKPCKPCVVSIFAELALYSVYGFFITSIFVLGFNYHILPAFFIDVWLQWDRKTCTLSLAWQHTKYTLCIQFIVSKPTLSNIIAKYSRVRGQIN